MVGVSAWRYTSYEGANPRLRGGSQMPLSHCARRGIWDAQLCAGAGAAAVRRSSARWAAGTTLLAKKVSKMAMKRTM